MQLEKLTVRIHAHDNPQIRWLLSLTLSATILFACEEKIFVERQVEPQRLVEYLTKIFSFMS
jgi:hypothetical protein